MPLQPQEITYNLGTGGSDQKTDEKFAPIGRPHELANVRFPKTGRISKRYGLVPATTDTVDGTATLQRLLPVGDGLIAIGKTAAGARAWYSLVRASDGNPLNSTLNQITGTPPVPRAWVDDIAIGSASSSGLVSVTAAVGLSQTCYFYASNTSSAATARSGYIIVDNDTGLQIATGVVDALLHEKQRVFAIPNSNTFALVYSEASANVVNHRLVSAAALGGNGQLNLNATHTWDAAAFGTSTPGLVNIVVAYREASTSDLLVDLVQATASAIGTASSITVTMTVAPLKIAVCEPYGADEDAVIIVHDATNGTRGLTVSSQTGLAVQSVWQITTFANTGTANHVAGVRLANAQVYLLHERNNASDYLVSVRSSTFAIAGTVTTPTTVARNLYLCSRPVLTSASTTPFFIAGHNSKVGSAAGLQHSRFLFEGTNVVGLLLRGDADLPQTAASVADLPGLVGMPADTSFFGSPVVEYMCPTVRLISTTVDEDGSFKLRSIAAMRFSVHASAGYDSVQDAGALLIQAGYLVLYDGVNVVENGFLLYPEIISATASNGAGSLPVNGSFSFVAVFTFLDTSGQLHRSAPSEVLTGTTGATDDTFTVLVRGLDASSKSDYGIELYRTEDDGTIFYLAEAQYGLIVGNNDTVSFTVTGTDATLIASTPLGQQSGILDNEQPSCPIVISSNGRRIQVVSGDDRHSVIQSKERIRGEGAAFLTDSNKRRITHDGDISALFNSGERWAAMKKRRLFVAGGDGPDDSGAQDTLSEFEVHPSVGIGCANPRSIVRTSQGTVFKSEKGFYLLDSGGGLVSIGLGIDDYKDFPVTSAVFHEDRNEAIFLLRDGPRLVLSLHETEGGVDPRWSIDEDDDDAEAYGDIAIVDGLLYAATEERADGNPRALMVEDVGGYADQAAAYPVVVRITTGWIPIAGQQQGRGRLYSAKFLGNAKSVHTARVRVAYDYLDAWIDDKSVTSANATAGGEAPYQWEFRPAVRQKCTAVKLEFTETLESAGEGVELNQIVLKVGVQPGTKRVRRGQRAAAT